MDAIRINFTCQKIKNVFKILSVNADLSKKTSWLAEPLGRKKLKNKEPSNDDKWVSVINSTAFFFSKIYL